MTETTTATLAEICVTACADLFEGAGEIMASPMAPVPLLGARLARLTDEPDLLITDGETLILDDTPAIGAVGGIEGWLPFSRVFDVVASGRRHVVMGANQIDRHGNQNLSAFGPLEQPTRQMFGSRGAPGNTINHATSYWVPRHLPRVFVEQVDIVCGLGYDKAEPDNPAFDHLHIHRVVSNLGVFDFSGPDRTIAAVSRHPGVTAEQIAENSGIEIARLDEAPETRQPTAEELRLIREVLDPKGVRDREVR